MRASGSVPAGIMIIGDCPDSIDSQRGAPYMGYTSQSYRRLLSVFQGISLYTTYACEVPMVSTTKLFKAVMRNPGLSKQPMHGKRVLERCWADKRRLVSEMMQVQPKIVLLLGVYPLFLFTGEEKAFDFRASHFEIGGMHFVTSLNPYLLEVRQDWIELMRADFKRVMRYLHEGINPPKETYEIFPEFGRVLEVIEGVVEKANDTPVELAADIETTPGLGVMDCIGFDIAPDHAICIPFTAAGKRDRSYFDLDEEVEVMFRLKEMFAHPNVTVCGQNWAYDSTWLTKLYGIWSKLSWDTMIAQHVLFAHLDKNLGFLGSLYSDYHKYWKDERKGGKMSHEQEQGQWEYNCKDVLRTGEIAVKQRALIEAYGLEEPNRRQHQMYEPVMHTMMAGHLVDHKFRQQVLDDGSRWEIELLDEALYLLDCPDLNLNSPKQLQGLFYDELQLPKQYAGRGQNRRVSCDETSLKSLAKIEPLIAPATQRLSDMKSVGKMLTSTPSCNYDTDQRFRCSFIIPGTDTYRFASRKDAFDKGTNAQNITKGGKQNIITIPNLRKQFIPESDCFYFAIDLDRADAQVVAWEANDLPLKHAFANKIDIHNQNTADIFGSCSGEDDPNRPKAKASVHAMNYVVRAKTLANVLGVTVKEAQSIIDRWFEAHPAIKDWHARVEMDLIERGYVSNAFGYRCYFPGRIEGVLSNAVAWAPQSTVANVTNQAYYNIYKRLLGHACVRMQVHDELVGVIKKKNIEHTLPILRDCFNVTIPYPEPLTIPVGLKLSETSWGDVKDAAPEFLEMWNQEIIN